MMLRTRVRNQLPLGSRFNILFRFPEEVTFQLGERNEKLTSQNSIIFNVYYGSSTAMQSQKYQEEEETEGIWYQGRTSTEAMIGPMLNTSLSLTWNIKIMCTLM